MSDQDPPAKRSLNVLPHSGKVEQLKKEFAERPAPPPRHPDSETVVTRFVDSNKTPQQKAIEEKVIDVLRSVYDPELPVNIYDLGLIYGIDVNEQNEVHVRMTLTAPACPVAGSLPPEVERRIETLSEVKSAKVELVWEPQWSKEMMSEAAQLELGLL